MVRPRHISLSVSSINALGSHEQIIISKFSPPLEGEWETSITMNTVYRKLEELEQHSDAASILDFGWDNVDSDQQSALPNNICEQEISQPDAINDNRMNGIFLIGHDPIKNSWGSTNRALLMNLWKNSSYRDSLGTGMNEDYPLSEDSFTNLKSSPHFPEFMKMPKVVSQLSDDPRAKKQIYGAGLGGM
jgi:hypothetical protein